MGASEVIRLLHKHINEEFTTTEIAQMLGLSAPPVKTVMPKLLKDPFENITRRELSFEEKKLRYGKIINTRIIVYRLTS